MFRCYSANRIESNRMNAVCMYVCMYDMYDMSIDVLLVKRSNVLAWLAVFVIFLAFYLFPLIMMGAVY